MSLRTILSRLFGRGSSEGPSHRAGAASRRLARTPIRRRSRMSLEFLEERTLLATLSIGGGGALSYTAAAGETNALSVSVAAGTYTFSDSVAISDGGGGAAAGCLGFTTTSVTCPDAAVSSIAIDLGDMGDSATITSSNDPTTVDGGAGSDSLVGNNSGDTFNVTGANSGAVTGLVTSFLNIESLAGGTGSDTFNIGAAGSLSGSINGSTGSDKLTQADGANTWGITGANSGSVTDVTGGWSGIESLVGGTGADTFNIGAAGTLSGSIDGNTGSDKLTQASGTNTFGITGADSGTVTDVTGGWSNIESLVGGTGGDTFNIGAAGTLSGSIDGGAGGDKLTQASGTNTFSITGANSGSVTDVTGGWSAIESLVGGTGADTFNIASGATLSGSIDGSTGSDKLTQADGTNTWGITGADSGSVTDVTGGWSGIESLVGGTGADTFNIASGATLSGSIDGSTGSDKLTQADGTNAWSVTGANSGTVTDVAGGWSSVESLVGGTGDDTFNIGAAGSLSGSIDGRGGTDALDYSAFGAGSPISVDLPTGTATNVAGGLVAGVGGDVGSSIENVTGGAAGDVIIGDADNNVLVGGAGSDFIADGFGDDVVDGGSESDYYLMTPGSSDTIVDSSGDDTVDYSGSSHGITIDMDLTFAPQAIGGGDFVELDGQIENFEGSSFADTVTIMPLAVPRFVHGNDPAGALPPCTFVGDQLIFNALGFEVVNNTTGTLNVAAFGYADVTYSTIETLNFINSNGVFLITGTGGADTFDMTALSADDARYFLNGLNPCIYINNVSELTFDSGGGSDTFNLTHAPTTIFAPVDGIFYDAGDGADTLNQTGAQFISLTNATYSFDTDCLGNISQTQPLTMINPLLTDHLFFTDLELMTSTLSTKNGVLSYTPFADVVTVSPAPGGVQTDFDLLGFCGDGEPAAIVRLTGPLATLTINGNGDDDHVIYTGFGTSMAAITTFDGGVGSDTLEKTFGTNAWTVSANNAGDVNTNHKFKNVENLTGGDGNDTFTINNGIKLDGMIQGGITGAGAGFDTLSWSRWMSGRTVTLSGVEIDGLEGTEAFSLPAGFEYIDSIVGSSADDTMCGSAGDDIFNLTGANAGTVLKVAAALVSSAEYFSSFEQIDAKGGSDEIRLSTNTASLKLSAIGGAGSDLLSYAGSTSVVTVSLVNNSATRVRNAAANGISGFESVTGGAGSDKLFGANVANTWHIGSTGASNAGDLNGSLFFNSIENLTGGTSSDLYIFLDGFGTLGKIDGGLGSDTLDYSAYTTSVTVNTITNTATGAGSIANIENLLGSTTASNTFTVQALTLPRTLKFNSTAGSSLTVAALGNAFTHNTVAHTIQVGGFGLITYLGLASGSVTILP